MGSKPMRIDCQSHVFPRVYLDVLAQNPHPPRVERSGGEFIVNYGNASARDVRNLIGLVRSRVQEKYGFRLEEELLYVGRWEEKHE